MSETNDTLQDATAEATLANNQQAEGAEVTVTPAADKLYAGKYKTVEEMEHALVEAQKLIGRKTIDPTEAAKVMGLTAAQTGGQVAETKAEAQQVAQAAGGDQLETWFNDVTKKYGVANAIQALTKHIVAEATKETLAPLNEQMSRVQQATNSTRLDSAIEALSRTYADFATSAEDGSIKRVLDADPELQGLIMNAPTKEQKMKFLKMAYLEARETKTNNAVSAAKVAGATDAKQREEMKGASVTSGSGAARRNDATPNRADAWLNDMNQHEKGRDLFK